MFSSTTTESVSLAEVLAYRQPGVVRRYCKEHGASAAEGEEVFRETLKWLYLCHRAMSEGRTCAMLPEIEKLDWMWHAFVLFTRDYAEFCQRHFGMFLHHVPNDDEDDPEQTPADAEALRAVLVEQYGLIYDVLGEETLTAWFDECRYAGPACQVAAR